MSEILNRRLYDRREIDQSLQVERWSPERSEGGNDRVAAQCFDISTGGVGITLPLPLIVGEILKIEYPINGNGMAVPIYVKVVWCRELEDESRAGLQFLH